MSCDCEPRHFMIHSEECLKEHPRPEATKPQYSNSPDALSGIYIKKQWCTIHGCGFYGDCEICLLVEIRDQT